ncbi:MAG TPA: biotin/lipoyl-containing protein [Candidatus Binataceae bacterium]|nr:biotin/lipoyl-containing protein [Candidatus Binataceae bacterium]
MKLKRPGEAPEFDVAIVARTAEALRVSIDGEEFDAVVEPAVGGVSLLKIGERRVSVRAVRSRDTLMVAMGPSSFTFVEAEARTSGARRGSATPEMAAPMPGKVLKILVSEGQAVAAGDPLIVLEAMKMETTLFAEGAAVIRKVRVEANQMVDHGAVLLELSPAAGSSTSESLVQDA